MLNEQNGIEAPCSIEGNQILRKKSMKANAGSWSKHENDKYVAFLYNHRVRFQFKLKKRKILLYKQMADFVGTRSTIQCRNHHQKYETRFETIKRIIEHFKKQMGIKNFKKCVKKSKQKKRERTTLSQIQQSSMSSPTDLENQVTDQINEFYSSSVILIPSIQVLPMPIFMQPLVYNNEFISMYFVHLP